jgi:ribosomal-protein-alanine N-acetyltransferase
MISFSPFPVITTERLLLRPLAITDDEEIFTIRSSEIGNKYLDRPIAHSIEDARAFIEKITTGIAINKWIFWVIVWPPSNKLIGTIGLWNIDDANHIAEIGYELHPDHYGKGIMLEAMLKVLDYGFDTMQLQTIDAYVHKLNERSIKLLEKLNFSQHPPAHHAKLEESEADMLTYSLNKK